MHHSYAHTPDLAPQAASPIGESYHSLVCCVRGQKLSFSQLPSLKIAKNRKVSTWLAYPATRNWESWLVKKERHRSKNTVWCWNHGFEKISETLVPGLGGLTTMKCALETDQHSLLQEQEMDGKNSLSPVPSNSEQRCPEATFPTVSFPSFPPVLKGWKGTPLTLPATVVRKEIFPHPCNPYNKKGLSCLHDKMGTPCHRGI